MILKQTLQEHKVIIVLTAIHVIAAVTLLALFDRSIWNVLLYGPTLPILLAVYCIAYCAGYFTWILYIKRPPQLKQFITLDFRVRALGRRRWYGVITICLCIGFSLSAYTAIKAALPDITSFDFDHLLYQADLFLHFGHSPWELLHPWVAHYPVTAAINHIYELWFLVLYSFVFAMAFSTSASMLRIRFFVSFIVIWSILGNVLALLLPSVGPCFFELLTGNPEPYSDLMNYLYGVNERYELSALRFQSELWNAYEDDAIGLGTGISAAPSIHIAMVTLLTLTSWKVHKILGLVMALYSVIIFIGSIHLGWHYAIDGYISIVATCLIWIIVGKLLLRPAKISTT